MNFARWVTVPGTRDLLFFSNYDASWKSEPLWPVRLSSVPAMVAMRGGGYLFLPGKRLLEFLTVAP